MNFLREVALASWVLLHQAAPFVLLGLAVAGLLHVLLPGSLVERWLGRPGLSGVFRGALLGLPLPLCSCSVVPVTLALRDKGASRPAMLSFLITTPESSVDSVVLTWGLLGPIMAVARPVAAFLSATLAGVVWIAVGDEPQKESDQPQNETAEPPHLPDCGHDHVHPVHPVHSGHSGHSAHHHGPKPNDEHSREAARREFWAWLRELPGRWFKPTSAERPALATPWRGVLRPALRYATVDLADDLLFWLLIGVLLAGFAGALLPADLSARGLGSGLLPMLILLALGIPMYMCASASTPVAAALLAKGVSPGAALVFLLAGPATNAATLLALSRHLGARFVKVYLGAVALGALACGLLLDVLWLRLGGALLGGAGTAALTAGPSGLERFCLVLLLALTAWRFAAGAARRGLEDLAAQLRLLFRWVPPRRLLRLAGAAATVLYLGSGFVQVPAGSQGFGFLCGALFTRDAGPGLHWLPPWPVGRWDVWKVDYPRKADVGFQTDLDLLARRRQLTAAGDSASWHSPVAAMNTNPEEATYLTGDENLIEMSFSVHYRVADAYAYFYRRGREQDLVRRVAQAVAREEIATRRLDDLLTTGRTALETALAERLTGRLDELDAGVGAVAVYVVDLHPPSEAVFAFRDVSSAREERETRIHRARATEAEELPRARGEAALTLARAEAAAASARTLAAGRAEAFTAEAQAFATERRLLRHLLGLESAERSLAGKDKWIVPAGSAPAGLTVWRDAPALQTEPSAPRPPHLP